MTNPGPAVTGAKPLPPSPPTMPVEKLIESMKPEHPLVMESGSGAYGGVSSGGSMPQ